MEDKLRAYMDHLFREVPNSKNAIEVKEEILQNLIDKYHDLLAEGKSEEAAYNIAVASIGDVSELLESLKKEEADSGTGQNAYMQWKQRSAGITAVAVMLYILCVIPPIITESLHIPDAIGACGMFLFIAVATGLLVYNSMTKPSRKKNDDTMMGEFKEWKSKNDDKRQAMKAVKSALWSLITVLYFIISFVTGAWHISWIIFLIGAACDSIIKAVFDLTK